MSTDIASCCVKVCPTGGELLSNVEAGMDSMQRELTVLFADLAGSTALYQTAGDVEAHRMVTDSLMAMKSVIENNQGILLRTVGDAVLASFDTTDAAFRASIAIQHQHIDSLMSVRVGFHFGEVIPDKGDIYGNAVNIAARVASFAKAEEIYTTEDSVEQLSIPMRSSTTFLDRIDFKGVLEPIRVYRVNWADEAPDTKIAGATSLTSRYATAFILDVMIGARHLRVDPGNPKLSFGRSVENDVVVNNDSTSRNHAAIEFYHGKYRLRDSSTNGTYIVRGGRKSEFIRREESVLEHFGSIGFGWDPTRVRADTISFKLMPGDVLSA
ncbi:MAG: adenylate/guanylate cyclase domain-containing protein [Granulosicoccus sp.]